MCVIYVMIIMNKECLLLILLLVLNMHMLMKVIIITTKRVDLCSCDMSNISQTCLIQFKKQIHDRWESKYNDVLNMACIISNMWLKSP